ncbi:galactitol-1-phosphate 5-dehydrogenase [Anaerosalibacter massiliensis]|uniref:galactitol-1-phosphate 5-dehydrogenase n=1 Tax=Anaerosalibacter massiliensis TaxID=1347392 RepID=UPI0005B2E9BB|nr:galactitol-1-phosphate 5-dehydrogenase [Anaerosalibacter massiliensis]
MKAARFYGIRDIRIEDVSIPEIELDDDVIVKVKVAGICGSDISKYSKTGPHASGEIFGHEFSGEVVEVGANVKNVKPGDSVAVSPSLPCFKCEQCKQGLFSRCEDLKIIGNGDAGGCFAEYVKISSRNLIKLPEGISYETAAGIEPACIAAHGMYRVNIEVGDTVAVLGTGPIGLLSIQWAKIFGATKIIAIDIFDEKLKIAKELGADICINGKKDDVIEKVKEFTNFKGVDVAVESAGTPITCAQALSLPKKGGTVLYAGIPYGDVEMPRVHFEKILRNELTVKGTWVGYSYPFPGREWTSTIHYMKKEELKISPLVTHRIKLDELPEMFEKIYKRDIFFEKIMVVVDNN